MHQPVFEINGCEKGLYAAAGSGVMAGDKGSLALERRWLADLINKWANAPTIALGNWRLFCILAFVLILFLLLPFLNTLSVMAISVFALGV